MFGRLQAKPGDKVAVQPDTFFATTNQKKGGTFNYNTQYAAQTFNPYYSYAGDNIATNQAFLPLYTPTELGAVLLKAADKIEEVDQVTWTVHIRDGLKFHPIAPTNGRAMTAQDVKFTYENGLTLTPPSYYASQQRWIDKVDAVDSNTVKFTSKVPNSMRFFGLPLQIVAQDAYTAFGDANAKKGVGAGPWMLDGEFNPDGVTNFVRHPDFFIKGRPFPDKMTFRAITDQAAHVAAFRSGQIDLILRDLPKPVADSTKGSDGVITQLPFNAPEMLWLDSSANSPLKDQRLRQAISLAVDRATLIKKLSFGEGKVNPPIPWGIDAWALPQQEVTAFYKPDQYDANVADAKKLFDAAGGASAGELKMINQTDIAVSKDMGPLIVDMLSKVGFKVTLVPQTTVEWLGAINKPGTWQISCNQWGTGADPLFFLTMYTSPAVTVAQNNRGGGADQAVDAAVNAVLSEFDPAARLQKVYEAQRTIMKAYINALSLFDGYAYYLTKSYLKDFRPGDSTSQYNQWDLWLDK
jgi:ABC-type transport system substrate-binding protein